MGVISRLRRGTRDGYPITLDQLAQMFSYAGKTYGLSPQTTYGTNKQEEPANGFEGYVQSLYRANGVVFACMAARQLLFEEARFMYRRRRSGRPGELFSTAALAPLERPWLNGSTGDLLGRMLQDADLAGNWFGARRRNGIKRLHPEWMTIVLGSHDDPAVTANDIDAEVVGYIYKPGGPYSSAPPVALDVAHVAHFAPFKDPSANYRGMSWLTPVIREIMGDNAATQHKLKFFENAATPNMVVSLDPAITLEQFREWKEIFEAGHEGAWNAYKTLYLGGGAKVEVVGKDLQQLEFKVTQGAGETRIAAAAGIPPVIVGLSEGLQAATYSNYGQARRRFADMTMRPLWRKAAACLSTIIPVPKDAELWYDDRDIPALQEDTKDAAEIQGREAATIKLLIEAGYEPSAVIDAVTAGDLPRLHDKHTGLVSVQLQKPGADPAAPNQAGRALADLIAPYLNGNGHTD